MTMPKPVQCLEDIVLMPKMSVGFSAQNTRSGKCSKPHSLTLNMHVSLLKTLLVTAGAAGAVIAAKVAMKTAHHMAKEHKKNKLKNMAKCKFRKLKSRVCKTLGVRG